MSSAGGGGAVGADAVVWYGGDSHVVSSRFYSSIKSLSHQCNALTVRLHKSMESRRTEGTALFLLHSSCSWRRQECSYIEHGYDGGK